MVVLLFTSNKPHIGNCFPSHRNRSSFKSPLPAVLKPMGDRPFACDQIGCTTRFAKMTQLKQHKKDVHHIGVTTWHFCPQPGCDYKHVRFNEIKVHLANAHNIGIEWRHCRGGCGLKFKRKSARNVHECAKGHWPKPRQPDMPAPAPVSGTKRKGGPNYANVPEYCHHVFLHEGGCTGCYRHAFHEGEHRVETPPRRPGGETKVNFYPRKPSDKVLPLAPDPPVAPPAPVAALPAPEPAVEVEVVQPPVAPPPSAPAVEFTPAIEVVSVEVVDSRELERTKEELERTKAQLVQTTVALQQTTDELQLTKAKYAQDIGAYQKAFEKGNESIRKLKNELKQAEKDLAQRTVELAKEKAAFQQSNAALASVTTRLGNVWKTLQTRNAQLAERDAELAQAREALPGRAHGWQRDESCAGERPPDDLNSRRRAPSATDDQQRCGKARCETASSSSNVALNATRPSHDASLPDSGSRQRVQPAPPAPVAACSRSSSSRSGSEEQQQRQSRERAHFFESAWSCDGDESGGD